MTPKTPATGDFKRGNTSEALSTSLSAVFKPSNATPAESAKLLGDLSPPGSAMACREDSMGGRASTTGSGSAIIDVTSVVGVYDKGSATVSGDLSPAGLAVAWEDDLDDQDTGSGLSTVEVASVVGVEDVVVVDDSGCTLGLMGS